MARKYIDQTDARYMDKARNVLETLPEYVSTYLNEKYAFHIKPSTLYAYCIDLKQFFDYFSGTLQVPSAEITVNHLKNIRRKEHVEYIVFLRTHNYNDSAIRRSQSSITGLFEYLVNSDEFDLDYNIPKSIPRPKLSRDKRIDTFSDQDIAAIQESVDASRAQSNHEKAYYKNHVQRDNLVITLLLTTGMRVSELVGINIGDFRQDYHVVDIIRKERTRQTIYLSDEARTSVLEYIEGERKELMKKAKQNLPDLYQDCKDPLLLTVRGHYAGRISTVAVERLVKMHSSETEALKKSPHQFRRTYGSSIYHETQNIGLTAELLGHSSPDVTFRYYAREDEKRQKESAGTVKFRKN